MKGIAYSLIVYFFLTFIFKLFGDMEENIWVNYYWVFSSLFFCFLFFKIKSLCGIPAVKRLYNKRDWGLYATIISLAAIYWGIMLLVRVYVCFRIDLYDKVISSARGWTVGGITILMIFIFLIFKTARRK